MKGDKAGWLWVASWPIPSSLPGHYLECFCSRPFGLSPFPPIFLSMGHVHVLADVYLFSHSHPVLILGSEDEGLFSLVRVSLYQGKDALSVSF